MASQSAVCIETNVEVQFGCWGLSHIGRLCAALTVVFKDNPLSPAATQTIPHFPTFFYLRSNLLRPLAPFASDLANSKLQTLIHPCGSSDEGNSFAAAAPSQSAGRGPPSMHVSSNSAQDSVFGFDHLTSLKAPIELLVPWPHSIIPGIHPVRWGL